MGKLVKFCNSCEEGFAEKFTFCPNCGGKLSVYEMKPIQEETRIVEESKPTIIDEPTITEIPPLTQTSFIETPVVETPVVENSLKSENTFLSENQPIVENSPIIDQSPIHQEISANQPVFESSGDNETIWDDEIEEIKPTESKVTISSGMGLSKDYEPMPSSMYRQTASTVNDDGFHLTIIEDPKKNKRRVMILGYGFLILALLGGWWVYSLFTKELNLAALGGNEDLYALIPDVEATPVEEELLEKNKDKGGGGGGGGKEEQDPVSKGRLAPQTEKPMIAPSAHMDKVTNPSIKIQAATEGPERKVEKSDEGYGDPNSTNLSRISDGPGTGGGQGTGTGRGQGSGRGSGAGSGEGSGMGSGKGKGIGDGTGDNTGDGGDPPPAAPVRTPKPTPIPTPKPAGVTQDMKILSKPKPGYTDAARQNNVTGVVRLRVTFSANGSIGGITPVGGLPYGLTEQAIAAARSIRFEPKKVDGVPQTVTKVIEYSFTIY